MDENGTKEKWIAVGWNKTEFYGPFDSEADARRFVNNVGRENEWSCHRLRRV
jgi:hypothetical protein